GGGRGGAIHPSQRGAADLGGRRRGCGGVEPPQLGAPLPQHDGAEHPGGDSSGALGAGEAVAAGDDVGDAGGGAGVRDVQRGAFQHGFSRHRGDAPERFSPAASTALKNSKILVEKFTGAGYGTFAVTVTGTTSMASVR